MQQCGGLLWCAAVWWAAVVSSSVVGYCGVQQCGGLLWCPAVRWAAVGCCDVQQCGGLLWCAGRCVSEAFSGYGLPLLGVSIKIVPFNTILHSYICKLFLVIIQTNLNLKLFLLVLIA